MPSKKHVGLGTFPLASVFTPLNKTKAQEIIRIFLDNGGYYIDTAPLYGFGEIENWLGEVLKDYPRDQFHLITKCGYIDVEGKTFKTVGTSGKFDDVIRECDLSLKRLGLDFIDLYFVHSPDPNTPIAETVSALTKLQDNGKVKGIGVSNVNLAELKEYNQIGKISYIQNRFSLINRSINDEFQKYLSDNDIKLVPYQPIERGQLSDKVLAEINLRAGDLRAGRSDWEQLPLKTITSWVKEQLHPLAQELDISISQLALAWTLHQEYVGLVIPGVTNSEQVISNLQANKVELSTEVISQIDRSYRKLEESIRDQYHQSLREFRGLNEKFY